jgi:hypothetical protein
MTKFPALEESLYKKTRRQIHSAAKVIGRFREALVKPIAKNDNIWLSIVDKGFCTPPMSMLKELEIGCNLESLIIEVADNTGKYSSITLNGKSQAGAANEIKSILSKEFDINADVPADIFNSEIVLDIDMQSAKDFLGQFVNFSELLRDFWKRIAPYDGVKSQICLWPHNFDNAFKWFSGKKIDDEDEFMGIGVSNGDEFYELPYVYMTFYPPLRKTNTLVIPDGAYLHDEGWTGLMLPYEAVAGKKDEGSQKQLIDNFFDEGFAGVKRGFSKR